MLPRFGVDDGSSRHVCTVGKLLLRESPKLTVLPKSVRQRGDCFAVHGRMGTTTRRRWLVFFFLTVPPWHGRVLPMDEPIDYEAETDEDLNRPTPKTCRRCGGDGYTSETIMRGAWEGTPDYRRCDLCDW